MSDHSLGDGWDTAFQSSKYSLRFELGGEELGMDMPVPRFLRAFDRARQVARDLFQNSETVVGIVVTWNAEGDLFSPVADSDAALTSAGFDLPSFREWETELYPEEEIEEERGRSRCRAYDLTQSAYGQDVLLWCAIACEMPIQPAVPARSYLADLNRGIILHVYDDRGMDVTALEAEALLALYRERNDWLLDYDRDRMSAAFGPDR